MSSNTDKTAIIITVSLLICLFGALLYHNTKYLSIHILGKKKEFQITSSFYRPVKLKHRKNYSDEPFTHVVDYFVDFDGITYEVFSEAEIANNKKLDGTPYYKERIGENVMLYYLDHVGISEGDNRNLNFNIGLFFFLVLMEFALIMGLKIQFFTKKNY